MISRRTLLQTATALAFAPGARAASLPIQKAVLLSMLPAALSLGERFQLARDIGFAQIELPTMDDPHQADEAKQAAEKTGLRIHSVMNMGHWEYPFSSADPAVVARGRQRMETSLRNAHLWGADTVLLVPAVVNAQTSYRQAYERSQQEIRRLLPLAAELKVVIAVEEVWNKFLLSPLEFARYVDEFHSPWVRAYFDVGNVVLYGYPQDWIRTLGPRIVKLHIKDFRFRADPQTKLRTAEWVALREGEIDWREIHQALADVQYRGSATVELPSGDEAYLREVNRRFDLILTGA